MKTNNKNIHFNRINPSMEGNKDLLLTKGLPNVQHLSLKDKLFLKKDKAIQNLRGADVENTTVINPSNSIIFKHRFNASMDNYESLIINDKTRPIIKKTFNDYKHITEEKLIMSKNQFDTNFLNIKHSSILPIDPRPPLTIEEVEKVLNNIINKLIINKALNEKDLDKLLFNYDLDLRIHYKVFYYLLQKMDTNIIQNYHFPNSINYKLYFLIDYSFRNRNPLVFQKFYLDLIENYNCGSQKSQLVMEQLSYLSCSHNNYLRSNILLDNNSLFPKFSLLQSEDGLIIKNIEPNRTSELLRNNLNSNNNSINTNNLQIIDSADLWLYLLKFDSDILPQAFNNCEL